MISDRIMLAAFVLFALSWFALAGSAGYLYWRLTGIVLYEETITQQQNPLCGNTTKRSVKRAKVIADQEPRAEPEPKGDKT